MEQRIPSFWREASLGGAVIGAVDALFTIGKLALAGGGKTIGVSLLSLVVFVVLIYLFVRRRAERFGGAGFSYGNGVAFVAAMMLFAGLVAGVINIFTNNYLFPDVLTASMGQTLDLLESTGIYDASMLGTMERMQRFMLFNPLGVLVQSVMNAVFVGLFWGLIVSAMVRRKPDIFSDDYAARNE